MSDLRVGINGFGRIGRCAFKQALAADGIQIVGINDLADKDDLAYLLKYDSVHGWYPKSVETDAEGFVVDGRQVPYFAHRNPGDIPWAKLGADVVLESTGFFRQRDKAALHLEAGAKRVIVTAPSGELDGTFVLGVNGGDYDPAKHRVVSMASCTTNCLAPVAKVLNERFGIEHLMITTVHAYTSTQALTDTPKDKRRRGRAAAVSIIPTTTGAARATALVLPELEGRMDGMAMRVPVPDGSITDIVATLNRDVTAESINAALEEAAESEEMQGILRVTYEALVSRDILGDPHSSIVDGESTMVLGKRMAKVLAWYDNEWGYSSRLVDFAQLMARRGV